MTPQPGYGPDLDALTVRAADRMWHVYPGYSEDRFPHAELLPSVRANVALAATVLRRGSGPTGAELRPARELGAHRANQGVPLESIIQAYRQTERVLVLDLVARAGADAGRFADAVISCFDELTDAMINAYRDASSAIETERRRVGDELLTSLAAGVDVGAARLERWASTLGIGTEGPWVALAVAEPQADPVDPVTSAARRLLLPVLQTRFRHVVAADVEGALLVLVGPGPGPGSAAEDDSPRSALLRTLASAPALAGAGTPLVCGVGEDCAALATAAVSCRQAREAVRVAAPGDGSGTGPGAGPTVVQYRDALVDVVLGGHPSAADELHDAVLGPLAAHPHLVETVEALLRNDLSQSATARALFVHANTVSHRVRRIQELTGRDPTALPDVVEFFLALRRRATRPSR
ncbi:PucR family transcriptional regulator [Kineococcus gynurae]|uniref:PucR family transcriptional regulator n=1 Tax=Kineococcus gynurae TaxID=452979 RepID=A0ABV5LVR1_9ACTN